MLRLLSPVQSAVGDTAALAAPSVWHKRIDNQLAARRRRKARLPAPGCRTMCGFWDSLRMRMCVCQACDRFRKPVGNVSLPMVVR